MARKPKADVGPKVPYDRTILGSLANGSFESRMAESGTKLASEPLGNWGQPFWHEDVAYVKLPHILVWNNKDTRGLIHIGQGINVIREQDWTVLRAHLYCGKALHDQDDEPLGNTKSGNWHAVVPLIPNGKEEVRTLPRRSFCATCERAFIIAMAQANAIVEIRKVMQADGDRGGPVHVVTWGKDTLFGYRNNDGQYEPLDENHDFDIGSHDEGLPDIDLGDTAADQNEES